MAILRFVGTVRTNKVGSDCDFEFEIDEDDLPADQMARDAVIEREAELALWGSGMLNWSFRPAKEDE